MAEWIQISLASIVLCAAGCASNNPIDVDAGGLQSVIATHDPVDIAISQGDKHRSDPYTSTSGKPLPLVLTGPIWSKVFVGNDADPLLVVDDANLALTMYAIGFAAKYTYQVQAHLSCNGAELHIDAVGTRASGGANFDALMKEAVERGVLDTAKQAKAASVSLCQSTK